jgi:ADP-ribose pyrophosphatase YjhB (NUDIX family)
MEYKIFGETFLIEDVNKYHYENQKIGVIVHIEDEKGNILLQQRGIKSRDENGLWDDVGGSLEETDRNYQEAIIREMKEEMGDDASISIGEPIALFHVPKKNTNWLFIIFYGKYLGGDIRIIEPDKCMGYRFFPYEEVLQSSEVTESCKYLTKMVRESMHIKK